MKSYLFKLSFAVFLASFSFFFLGVFEAGQVNAQVCGNGYTRYIVSCKESNGKCVTDVSDLFTYTCRMNGSSCEGDVYNYICGFDSSGVCKRLGDGSYVKVPCNFETPTPTKSDGASGTPAPSPNLICQDIKLYSTSWSLLTASQIAELTTGNQVNFCVRGGVTQNTTPICTETCRNVTECKLAGNCPGTQGSQCGIDANGNPKYNCTYRSCTTTCVTPTPYPGSFTKARFVVNGTVTPDSTLIRPGSSNEVCATYTFPEEVFSYTVSGEIYHSLLGWVY